MPSNLQLKGWWQETRIHQPTNFLDTLVFHELGPLTNRPAFQLVFNRLSGLLLICWQVHALQQGPHSVPILGRAHVVHRSLSHSSRFRKKKEKYGHEEKKWFHPGRLTWNLKITQLKSTIIWTKPSFSGSMLIFQGVVLHLLVPSSTGLGRDLHQIHSQFCA